MEMFLMFFCFIMFTGFCMANEIFKIVLLTATIVVTWSIDNFIILPFQITLFRKLVVVSIIIIAAICMDMSRSPKSKLISDRIKELQSQLRNLEMEKLDLDEEKKRTKQKICTRRVRKRILKIEREIRRLKEQKRREG